MPRIAKPLTTPTSPYQWPRSLDMALTAIVIDTQMGTAQEEVVAVVLVGEKIQHNLKLLMPTTGFGHVTIVLQLVVYLARQE